VGKNQSLFHMMAGMTTMGWYFSGAFPGRILPCLCAQEFNVSCSKATDGTASVYSLNLRSTSSLS